MFIDTNTNVKMLCLCWCSNLGSLVYKRNALPKFDEGKGGGGSIQVSTKRLIRADICEFHIGWNIVKANLTQWNRNSFNIQALKLIVPVSQPAFITLYILIISV